MLPTDKIVIHSVYGYSKETDKTYAEENLSNLTAEVLRDIGRNESNSWEWRKAAVKLLIERKHNYSTKEYFNEILAEINKENEAEQAVFDVVESAIEQPLLHSYEDKIQELQLEIERLKKENLDKSV